MTEQEYTEMIKEVQAAELEILKVFADLCNRHNIKYSLHGGTLLGAVRHGGFIPWDDDLDVILDRGEYNRFIDAWNEENPQGYYLQTKEKEEAYDRNFLKIRKEGTEFVQERDKPGSMHTGVFIDVEPVDRAPRNRPERAAYFWNAFKYEVYSREYVPGGTKLMRAAAKLLLALTSHRGRMKSLGKLCDKVTAYNDDRTLDRIIVANFATMKRPLPPDIMDSYCTMPFEGEEYMVIEDRESLLRKWYGDYMKLPPKSAQRPGHIPLKVSLGTASDGSENLKN
ncbi:MAG: LicD family protein [Mogibacterium sp.]|nr:LicD family protein [Mogibacterium sp.]